MPRERSCWPTLNWFCVTPTSSRKKSVNAFPLRTPSEMLQEGLCLGQRGKPTCFLDPIATRKSRGSKGASAESQPCEGQYLYGLLEGSTYLRTRARSSSSVHSSCPPEPTESALFGRGDGRFEPFSSIEVSMALA